MGEDRFILGVVVSVALSLAVIGFLLLAGVELGLFASAGVGIGIGLFVGLATR